MEMGAPGHARDGKRARVRLSPWQALRAGIVLLVVAALSACSGATSATLAQLVEHQQDYDGSLVRTSGTVRSFTDANGTYYVIEDATSNRVELLPPRDAARYVGRKVTVTGRFEVSAWAGRILDVESAAVASGG